MANSTMRARESGTPFDPDVVVRRHPDDQGRPGAVDVDLVLDGRRVSTCEVAPFTLRIGAATVRMDGIGGVSTPREYRGRGYARRMLNATIAHMGAGDAALTMLYGIPNLYPKFGYTAAGPSYTLSMPITVPAPSLAANWQLRPAQPADLPAIRRLYDRDTADAVGAVVRSPDSFPWTALARLSAGDLSRECRVAMDPEGAVAAYAWGGDEFWATHQTAQTHPQSLVLAEIVARDALAADAILATCHAWALEEARARDVPITAVVLALPPTGPVAAAAMHRPVVFQCRYSSASEFMVRVLHTGHLLSALAPELERRLQTALPTFRGTLRLQTDAGSAALRVSPGGLTVEEGASSIPGVAGDAAEETGAEMVAQLPQTTLARLALGAYAPADLLARLEQPPTGSVRALLEALFPSRYPHLSIPDRF